MEASMQHLRRLDASTEPQMGPQQTQPGAAEHGFGGDPRQQGDSQPKPEPWSQQETAAFVLGLYLWGEQFTSIQALIGTKTVDEVVMFYYDKVVGSVLHRRWQEALLNGGLKGEALISGERQARIRGQLSRLLGREGMQEADMLLQEFNKGVTSLTTLVMRLVEAVGRDKFVHACLPQACANCHTMKTPLWRPDRESGQMLCNACSIYFRQHKYHRTLELIKRSERAAGGASSGRAGAHKMRDEPDAPELPPIRTEARRLRTQSTSTPRSLKRTASEMDGGQDHAVAPTSDQEAYGSGSGSDGGGQRRSTRQRKARDWGDVEMPCWAVPKHEEGPSDASADEGCGDPMDEEDDSEAEEERCKLIDRLLAKSDVVDFDGAVLALAGLRQAGCIAACCNDDDANTGAEQQPLGTLRVFREPAPCCAGADGVPSSPGPASSPGRPNARHAAAQRAADARDAAFTQRSTGVAGGGVRKSNLGRPAQLRGSPPVNGPQGTGSICANCNVEKTPLWRKDHASGLTFCNACGIFLKTHKRHRPVDVETHTLVRTTSGKKKATKGLKRGRSGPLGTTAAAATQQSYHSARQLERARSSAAAEQQRLPRFDSGEAPSATTASLDQEGSQMDSQQATMRGEQHVPAHHMAQIAKAMAAERAGPAAWEHWHHQQRSLDPSMLVPKPLNLHSLKASGVLPINIDARAGPLPGLEAGGQYPPFKWSEEGGLVHPGTPPRARALKHPAGASHLQRQGSSLGSAHIVHALFAPAPLDSRPLSRTTSHQ